jgi:5-methyltetrahydropteroyltriglutamate--homocysteine methyltransferase
MVLMSRPLRVSAISLARSGHLADLTLLLVRKWFDSNYHYIVPELSASTKFSLASDAKPVAEFNEAKEAGFETRPVLLGPISYLLLGKNTRDSAADFQPLSLLDSLVTVYDELLKKLKEAGATSVQIDEPVLVLDQDKSLASSFKSAYEKLGQSGLAITLATYFGRVTENLDFVKDLPIDALHIDLDRARGAPEQVDAVVAAVKDSNLKLSLGLVSGRNVWKCDLEAAIAVAKKVVDALGSDRVIVASSSSLLHTPVTLANETKLSAEQKDWFSFATEKVAEIAAISKAVNGQEDSVKEALEANKKSIAARREFEKKSDASVRERLAAVTPEQYNRKDPFTTRIEAQKQKTPLPKFPTTTIGSFPQTKEIRQARAKFTKGDISSEEYDKFIASEIEHVIKFQEKVGLDVLVHGEPERNDMVQYFGEKLEGFVFTENGWVQSYGSRYVRPPIIVSDVSRPTPMTVHWSSYAQSLTKKPVKGMLTGPVTILNWSFPRIDVSRETQSKQLALALRDEVMDLEKANIFAIQVDEPAIREGLPLRKADWEGYLRWAVDSFKLATSGVENTTQVHS